jgi:alkylation response protein AidB-like acyl-CoA dehydrogenase
LELTEAQRLFRQAAARFADEVVAPMAERLDAEEAFPEEIYRRMAEGGFLGIAVASERGGAGADILSYALVMEELSRGYSAVADLCGLVELVAGLLERLGTEEQKARYLGPLLEGESKCAFAITESEAGSDVSGLKSVARKVEGGWRLSGSKLWINNGPVCDFAVVLARAEGSVGAKGLSTFVVERAWKGFSSGRKERKMGQCASQVSALFFDDILLPEGALLGTEGAGFKQMMQALDKGRVGIAALATGICQAALDASVAFAKQRVQFGRPIADFQAIQWMLADMAKDTHAARLMVHHAAHELDAGERATMQAAMAKCFASDAAVRHTANAVQIHGGSGYIRGFEVERLYRDAKITQIYEGTNQIQRMLISRALLA